MAQRNGLEAIGSVVCREFGEDGFFVGTVVGFDFDTKGNSLYSVEYTDEDKEDLDQEEFNFAYAPHLEREGWELSEGESCQSEEGRSDNEADPDLYRPPKVGSQGKFLLSLSFIQDSDLSSLHMFPT